MITAEHRKWADLIFKPYIFRLMKKHFHSIHLLGEIPDFDPDKPIFLLPNHSTWWDGFYIYLLNKKILKRSLYIMMLESQLKLNRFFRYLGAYSIESDSYRELKRSLDYTHGLLSSLHKENMVVLFPQGELQAWNKRPVRFKPGLDFLLKRTHDHINLCFLMIRAEYKGEQYPQVYLKLTPINGKDHTGELTLSLLEKKFNQNLDKFEEKIIAGESGTILLEGTKSINERINQNKRIG